jgi:metallo-beta-lactamase family protein
MVPVQAHIEKIESMSAHADSGEILQWLSGFKQAPRMTFIVHGEIAAMEALSSSIQTTLKWKTKMPEHQETVELGAP